MMSLDPQEEQERQAADERKVVIACVGKVYAGIRESLGSIGGLDVAAGICGINAGDLSRSLNKDGRKLSVDHAMAVVARLRRYNATLATKIGSALVYPIGLDVFPRVTLTPEEQAHRYRAKLLAIGQSLGVGDQLVTEALGEQR